LFAEPELAEAGGDYQEAFLEELWWNQSNTVKLL
jgi:hypothetical protein